MDFTLREFRIGDPRDAELLAAMWNASDAGWPGGWTGGIPDTDNELLLPFSATPVYHCSVYFSIK